MVTRSRMRKSKKKSSKTSRLKKFKPVVSEAGKIISNFGMEIAKTMKAGAQYEKQMREKSIKESPSDRKIKNNANKVESRYKNEVSRIKKIERQGKNRIIIEVV